MDPNPSRRSQTQTNDQAAPAPTGAAHLPDELEIARQLAARLRRRAIYLSIALTVTLGLALVAGGLAYQSRQSVLAAQRQQRIARARELAAAALTNLAADPERSILLALQAVTTTYAIDNHLVVPEAEDALHQAVQASHIRLTLTGHLDVVDAVAFSPDGQRLATASKDGTVKLWSLPQAPGAAGDSAAGQQLLTLTGTRGAILSLAFSPDGRWLATGNVDNTADLWNTASGQKLLTLSGHIGAIYGVAFSPDGALLASASGDGTAKVWSLATSADGNVITGKERLTLSGHSGAVYSVAFSPDGTRLATGAWYKSVRIWSLAPDAATPTTILTGHTDVIYRVAFSPDGTRLASASQDGTARIWDVTAGSAGTALLTLSGHAGAVESLAFSRDGALLATAAADHIIRLWSLTPGAAGDQPIQTLIGHTDAVKDVAFSPDGTRLASASWDKTAKVWALATGVAGDVVTGQELLILNGQDQAAKGIGFSPLDGGRHLASAGQNSNARIWSLAPGAAGDTLTSPLPLTLPGQTEGSVAFSPDGTRLATANLDHSVNIWSLTTGPTGALVTNQQAIRVNALSNGGLAFSPDGTRLATTSLVGNTAEIWSLAPGAGGDAAAGRALLTLTSHGDAVYAVAFSPDGKRLATASLDGTAIIWDAATGNELLTLTGHAGEVFSVAFSPDGKRVATGSNDRTAKVWDAATGRELLTLTGHTGAVFDVAFSPLDGGQQLATASLDGTVKVWSLVATSAGDTAAGQELFELSGHAGTVLGVAFSPDGTRLATANGDGTVRIYPASIQTLVGLARARLTRGWTPAECLKYLQLKTCPARP